MRENECILDAKAVLRFLLDIFDKTPKLDFVDCLLYGYKFERDINIITIDQKLRKRLDNVSL